MTQLTKEATELLDRYLARTRLSLRGTGVEADEIERDVRAHIDEAFADHDGEVAAAELQEVLSRLGSPDQWVPEDEVPAWRRMMVRLSSGPEDWRLAYLCFGLTLLGLITAPVGGIFLIAGAVFLARATIDLAREKGEPLGARRWLVYPPVVMLSIGIILAIVSGPIVGAAGIAVDGMDNGWVDFTRIGAENSVGTIVAFVMTVAGVWFVLLAGIAALAVRPVQWALVPIANGFRRRHSAWLAVTGLVLAIGSGTALMLL